MSGEKKRQCCIKVFFMAAILSSVNGVSDFEASYICHCADQTCPEDGHCSKCASGWFGPACQYENLARDNSSQRVTDEDDESCEDGRKSVEVALNGNYSFTWLRLVFQQNETLTDEVFSVAFKDTSQQTVDCSKSQMFRVDDWTRDIFCDITDMVQSVTINWQREKSVCSLYISGGRNVAIKQQAVQSSDYGQNVASNAVNGDREKNIDANSCTHTNKDLNPSWTLTLKSKKSVNRYVIVNRDSNSDRLIGFTLQSYDMMDQYQPVFVCTDRSDQAKPEYTIVSTTHTIQIVKISLAVQEFLTLCEVEVFGDSVCESGMYGRECENTCNCENTTESCFVATGGCPSGCAAGFYGEDCYVECPTGRWGVDCLRSCSDSCYNNVCNSTNGDCLEGCMAFTDPPKCHNPCGTNSYGHNCSFNCPLNCYNNECNTLTGLCESCILGYQGPGCESVCNTTSWGPACNNNCNVHCIAMNDTAQALCHHVTGVCTLGCMAGYDDCGNGGLAKSTTGLSDETLLIVIIVPAAVVLLLVIFIIAGAIFLRRRRGNLKRHMDTVTIHSNDASTSTTVIIKDQTLTESTTEGVKTSHETYYNATVETTSISVKNLNSFMRSHDQMYFADQFNRIPDPKDVSMENGYSEENKKKNRYKNICTYDHSRVHLEINTDKNEGSYINASYVASYNKNEKFIASQGPNELILNDFLRMLWEQNVEKVVMLTNLIEEGKAKCEKYWPEEDETVFGDIKVRLTTTDVYADYTIRQLELVKKGKPSQHLTQFHFTSWPDKGVPTSPWGLVGFEQKVASCPTTRPILVHCSAGVGRTGTFIALQNVIKQAEQTGEVDFFNTVAKLREDRIFMIQTPEQYEFLHKATQVALICLKTTVKASDISIRIRFLESTSLTGRTEMNTEYEAISSVIEDINNRNIEFYDSDDGDFHDGNVYQNNTVAAPDTKNRHPSVKPAKTNRVRLMYVSQERGSYINAVLIPSFRKQSQQILTQLPMPTTVGDFWRMVEQYRVSLIVSFDTSPGSTDQTIGRYMPEDPDHQITIGNMEIRKNTGQRGGNWEDQKLTIKTKSSHISAHQEDFHATHLRCTEPELQPKDWLSFVKQVRSYNAEVDGSIVFMCRNGATYSGIACVLTNLMDRLDHDLCLSVPLVVGAVKSIRPQVIHTLDQYKTIYAVMKLYNESSPVYNTYDLINNKSLSKQSVETANGIYLNSAEARSQ
ncbi:unnamed protein product [Lymnaea stagnalis]|uniref:protein-tyrosine-phosphatase n=1 Tax=Lymnaea stagnalis TaxID=6523 RepID=A0AAV2HS19_LYMST